MKPFHHHTFERYHRRSKPKKVNSFKTVLIDGYDVACLIYNMFESRRDNRVGWNDAEKEAEELALNFKRKRKISTKDLESMLYCCNMFSEIGRFWHPQNKSFSQWIKKLGLDRSFCKKYNTLTDDEFDEDDPGPPVLDDEDGEWCD